MSYKFGNIDIDNKYDGIKTSYYKGTAVSGKLFFRDPQASNPYNLDANDPSYPAESLIDIISNDYEVRNGGTKIGDNTIERTLVSPYYIPYLKNDYYLLVGDMRSYCISGIGLEASSNGLLWCARLAISGPPTPVPTPTEGPALPRTYQIKWVLKNLNTDKYYAHAQGSGQYEWQTEPVVNNRLLSGNGLSEIYIYFDADTSYQLELCLEKISNGKRSPWVGCTIATGSRQYAGGGAYYWTPTINPINTNAHFTTPYTNYQRTIFEDYTRGIYSMFPLYSLNLVSESDINWDPNPFSTAN